VYLYYDCALQGRRFRVAYKGALGLGLATVYLYYGCALQGRRFRVV
jgi:hypothetical protein